MRVLGRVHLAGFPATQHSFKLNLKNVFYSNTELNYLVVERLWLVVERWRCGGRRKPGPRKPPMSHNNLLVVSTRGSKGGVKVMSRLYLRSVLSIDILTKV